ncbi:MAG TPA: hypothetical protein VIJ96_01630 [Acidothermaceae bacterium]
MSIDSATDREHRQYLGQQIKNRRENVLAITVEVLAERAGLDPAPVTAIEAGTYVDAFALPIEQVHALERALDWASGSYERVLVDMLEPYLTRAADAR